jgi:hypothetical protein
MPFLIRYVLEVDYIGIGEGPRTLEIGAAKIKLGSLEMAGLTLATPATGQPTGYIQVPGGETPTQANFRTALQGTSGAPTAGGMTADLDTAIATNLARILTFATGGG